MRIYYRNENPRFRFCAPKNWGLAKGCRAVRAPTSLSIISAPLLTIS